MTGRRVRGRVPRGENGRRLAADVAPPVIDGGLKGLIALGGLRLLGGLARLRGRAVFSVDDRPVGGRGAGGGEILLEPAANLRLAIGKIGGLADVGGEVVHL